MPRRREREPFEFPELDVTTTVCGAGAHRQQDHSVDREEDRAASGFAKRTRSLCPTRCRQSDRHRGDGEHEQQSVVRIVFGFVEVPERRDTDSEHPPTVGRDRERARSTSCDKTRGVRGRAHVQSDDEGEKNDSDADGSSRGCASRESREQDAVAEAGDRKESVKPCVSSHDDGLEIR